MLQFDPGQFTDRFDQETTVEVTPGGQAEIAIMPAITISTATTNSPDTHPSQCPLIFTDETEDPWKNLATFDQNTRIATIHANAWVGTEQPQPWFQFLLQDSENHSVGWKLTVVFKVDCSTASISDVLDSGSLSVVATNEATYGAGVIVHNLFKSN